MEQYANDREPPETETLLAFVCSMEAANLPF